MAIFEKFSGTNGQFYFRLKSSNGQTILSSEGYVASSARENGISSVRTNAPYDTRYRRLNASNGQYYFTLTGANGETIGTSETYLATSSRENGIEAVKRDAPFAS
jgi:uncharacterized protein YegP (UPF0339 family)